MDTTPLEPTNLTPPFATVYASVGNRSMPIARPLPRRLLGVWAHPDDEAYLSAGLMARVVDAGGSVTIVTATSGELGTDDASRSGTDEFAAFRREELIASVAELGVTDVRFLGVGDGECDVADDDHTIRTILDVVDDVRPDAIVTFGPDGITGHPDHKYVSSWTTQAWNRSDRRSELLYAVLTNDFLARYADLHERLGVFDDYDHTPASVMSRDVALGCSLTPTELRRKRRALARHASQTAELAAVVGEDVYARWWVNETFRLPTARDGAAAPNPRGRGEMVAVR